MEPVLTFVQLNIERSKHLDRVIPFLKKMRPDVVCLQELMERDTPRFQEDLGMNVAYALNCYHPAENNNPGIMGTAVLSRYPFISVDVRYYHGQRDPLPVHTPGVPGTGANAVLMANINARGEMFRVGTTHFTWTPDGSASDMQRDDLQRMLAILNEEGEFVFSGDFNAPRGGEIFGEIASRYTDNIPPEIVSSIDGGLHRAGPLPLMVDGIFSTPGYAVFEVTQHTGISDHCGFSAKIAKI